MKNLAIIPARSGSKRIPGKNIKLFKGKPIIEYSIEVALKSNVFKEVMVSTDDSEIAEIAIKAGAKVPFFRSEKNSGDFATTLDVINEVIINYEELGLNFDSLCCIYPTAPLIQVSHLTKGLDMLSQGNHDSVFPVMEFSYPIWRGVELDANQKPRYIWPEFHSSRSQDLKKVYHDAGQWYWLKSNKLGQSIMTKNSSTLLLKENEAHDIDNDMDWKIAELKFDFWQQNR